MNYCFLISFFKQSNCHLFTNRQVLHHLLKITKWISHLANFGHTEKTRFFFKLLLILPIRKLATKRDTLFVPIHSPQVDQLFVHLTSQKF